MPSVPAIASVLATKLYLPHARPNRVPRPRLLARLHENRPITLIAAPAGFGKTTLVSEWIPHSPHRVSWLSLDDADNDPTRFWTYVVAALQTLRPDLGDHTLDLLHNAPPQSAPIPAALTALINEIAALPNSLALILDDYHVIHAQSIHESMTFLLEHLPPNLRLVIASRADPPLPLARLRARDQLTELRADDLRFTPDEAVVFLNQAMGLALSADDIARLEARTEGWIAGLQLAALSVQGRDEASNFIQAFSGSHRYVLNYLAEEVLPLPANFRHEPYVPGLAMAARSDLLIHHGGYGSCQTGLYTGKPAAIIPTYSERERNARRIAALGAGAFVPVETASGEKHVRVEELRATVRHVLSDPSFTDNARQIGERMRAYGGASQAAQLIERFGQRVGMG